MGKIRYLSVCSGIEAASVAWHDLEWEPVAFAEIDPFASAILAHRYPGVPNLGDFTQIGGEHVGAIDALVGGTPCQSFSVAGLRGGLGDERGNLALEFLRLADRTRPRWILWENVPGVFSATSHVSPDSRPPDIDLDGSDGPKDGEEIVVEDEYDSDEDHAFSCFLAGLSELGYGYAYGTLDAQYFGVPQRRRRVFVVGYLGDWRSAAAVLLDRHCLSGHPAPRREAGQSVACTVEDGSGERGYPDPSDGNREGLVPLTSRTLGGGGQRGWSNDLDRSGAFIPGPYWDGSDTADTLDASNASKQQAMPEKRRFQAVIEITHSLRADGFDASEDGTGRGTPLVRVGAFNNTDQGWWNESDTASGLRDMSAGSGSKEATVVAFSCKDSGFDSGETSPTLRSLNNIDSNASGGGKVAVAFVQNTRDEVRLMGGDGQSIGALSAEPGMKQQCNIAEAVAFESRFARYGRGAPSEMVPPLKAESGGTGKGDAAPLVAFQSSQSGVREVDTHATLDSNNGSRRHNGVQQGMAVRRLTPTEFERLQGFPDGWTKITSKTADGPRYKVIGNSMAVPVMRWIGERIQAVEDLKSVDSPRS